MRGRRIDDALERVDLLGRARDRVGGYSSGMRQRLGIAAALLRQPRLLLLDEPTSGLDPVGAREVGALLRELSSQGVAVLLSSHLIGEIESTCDGFTVVARGQVVWSGSAAQLRAQAPASAYSLATSDDEHALEIAELHPGVRARRSRTGELELEIKEHELDSYVLALGQEGVAVRRLELRLSPLESMFFALTGDAAQQRAELPRSDEARPEQRMSATGGLAAPALAPPLRHERRDRCPERVPDRATQADRTTRPRVCSRCCACSGRSRSPRS